MAGERPISRSRRALHSELASITPTSAQHAFRCRRLYAQADAAQWYSVLTKRMMAWHPLQSPPACQEGVKYELCRHPPYTQGLRCRQYFSQYQINGSFITFAAALNTLIRDGSQSCCREGRRLIFGVTLLRPAGARWCPPRRRRSPKSTTITLQYSTQLFDERQRRAAAQNVC